MQPALNSGQAREVVIVEALSVKRQRLERCSRHDITLNHLYTPTYTRAHAQTGMTL